MNKFLHGLHRDGVAAFLFGILALAPAAYGQTAETPTDPERPDGTSVAAVPVSAPAMTEIMGIKIGTSADEAVDKLGKPENKDATGMYFDLPDGQAMQLVLDDKKQVTTLSMIYTGKDADAPEFAEVFGTSVEAPKGESGSIFKRIRYSDLGIWVAYSRIGDKDNPMTTVTIQKIRH